MYQARRPSHSAWTPIRNLRYHVLHWGNPAPDAPLLVLVHGWMDVAASFQFVVDAFSDEFVAGRRIIAPDWRGFGQTGLDAGGLPRGGAPSLAGQDNYWFADYLADLDFLLDQYAGERPVDLVGHSMGGNVAMLYAGVRPARIRRLINLEGFGMPATQPDQAPKRYARWMDELKQLHRGELDLRDYDDVGGVARRLIKTNPRLDPGRAAWLAQHWARPNAQGRWQILGDAAHKVVSAHLYQVEEALAIYRHISAPTLSMTASDDSLHGWWEGRYTLEEYRQRIKSVPLLHEAVIDHASHMMHHDQPEAVARRIEDFLTASFPSTDAESPRAAP